MRVLLIEDDSATAQSIELMLKSESFNVYLTDFVEEGIDLGKLYNYDIILLDLNLPDISGYEVVRALRLAKVKTPILILSGLAGTEDKVKGLGLALQLRFHVGALCLSLMGSSPQRPGDDEVWFDSFSSEARGDAADFLHGPADERWARQFRGRLSVLGLRSIVFGGGAIALA